MTGHVREGEKEEGRTEREGRKFFGKVRKMERDGEERKKNVKRKNKGGMGIGRKKGSFRQKDKRTRVGEGNSWQVKRIQRIYKSARKGDTGVSVHCNLTQDSASLTGGRWTRRSEEGNIFCPSPKLLFYMYIPSCWKTFLEFSGNLPCKKRKSGAGRGIELCEVILSFTPRPWLTFLRAQNIKYEALLWKSAVLRMEKLPIGAGLPA